jgi:TPP-dependent pyruvate/acetoin dehydrogenase alpha subunit
VVARAQAFGLAAVSVDGQDLDAVAAAVREARQRGVAGGGPSLIEAITYRFSGHGSGERASYRTKDEIEHHRATRDPISIFAERLRGEGELDDGLWDELTATAEERVAAAIEFAESAAWPALETARGGVGWDE